MNGATLKVCLALVTLKINLCHNYRLPEFCADNIQDICQDSDVPCLCCQTKADRESQTTSIWVLIWNSVCIALNIMILK